MFQNNTKSAFPGKTAGRRTNAAKNLSTTLVFPSAGRSTRLHSAYGCYLLSLVLDSFYNIPHLPGFVKHFFRRGRRLFAPFPGEAARPVKSLARKLLQVAKSRCI
ncbi:hypothetical protein D1841_13955 [Neglecta sp. X4]|nr:hypothetical protein [Neglectibacter sp. 59]NBJ74340.1 hypothetical protein [Neglectibacter sp. X4]NCE81784.1 hypothetical protein [Neglectibacter sp. X58]